MVVLNPEKGLSGEEKRYSSDIRDPDAAPMAEILDIEQGDGELKRNLKGRHMQMIAIGGSIGAGLFVGSGSALASGGPGSLVIDFIIIGFMLLLTVNALGELAGKPLVKATKETCINPQQLCTLLPDLSTTIPFASSMRDGDSLWVGIMP